MRIGAFSYTILPKFLAQKRAIPLLIPASAAGGEPTRPERREGKARLIRYRSGKVT
jgi:hypothetical protein